MIKEILIDSLKQFLKLRQSIISSNSWYVKIMEINLTFSIISNTWICHVSIIDDFRALIWFWQFLLKFQNNCGMWR